MDPLYLDTEQQRNPVREISGPARRAFALGVLVGGLACASLTAVAFYATGEPATAPGSKFAYVPGLLLPRPLLARSALPAAVMQEAPPGEQTIAVAGATGRTGQLVVKQLLSEGYGVKAVMRNLSKAADVMPGNTPKLEHVQLDFANATKDEVHTTLAGADAVIWCASGFSDAGASLDVKAMEELPGAFEKGGGKPRVVMLSSAGVTRTAWPADKQARLVGACDIPIIRLNPGGILECKAKAESLLRESGVPYCIVRPTGLKFDGSWPRGRPILSQGDVAVGRATAEDVASTLCSVLQEPAAAGKTFEMFTLAGYPPPRAGLGAAFEKLVPDKSASGPDLADDVVDATYAAMQQCLPGEEQDATKLEMGRTYEQVDSGEVAREPGAAPTEREVALASGVAGGAAEGKKTGKRAQVRELLRNLWP